MGKLKTSVIVFPVLWQLRDLTYGLFTLSFSWLIQRVGHYESGLAERISGFQLSVIRPARYLADGRPKTVCLIAHVLEALY